MAEYKRYNAEDMIVILNDKVADLQQQVDELGRDVAQVDELSEHNAQTLASVKEAFGDVE